MSLRCVVSALLLLTCSSGFSFAQESAVSLIQVIANPEKYDGKKVAVIGFVKLEFEGNAIYLHREDFEQMLTKNALWLDLTDSKQVDKSLEGYALIVGTFNAKERGHMGLCSGTIENIERAQPWRSRKDWQELGKPER